MSLEKINLGYTMILLQCLTLFAVCIGAQVEKFSEGIAQAEESLDWRTELQQINAELKDLEDEKNRYLAAARRHEDDGLRWQFQQNEKQEARRAFERADIKRQAAQMLQGRIDALNARKMQILQEHPEANGL
jgi:DNA repair exonuclease SbcCD ATPase subunit